jgi:hypothetical protein
VLQEGSRHVKEGAWSLGSLQAGQTNLSVGGVAVDGRSIMSGMHGGMQLFSGRPRTQSVEDLGDRLEAAYAKARSKDKKLTRAEFLHQCDVGRESLFVCWTCAETTASCSANLTGFAGEERFSVKIVLNDVQDE